MSTGSGGASLSPLKRALLTIEKLQARVRELESGGGGPVAVVGMACRFPGGATDPDSYFENLLEGRDAVVDRPPTPRPGWPETSDEGPFPYPPAGYLLHDVYGFDPEFFGISPREAESIDPQQRVLLEVAWEALEAAGRSPGALEGTPTGVFVGLAGNDYAQLQLGSPNAPELVHSHYASGVGHSMASGRISYLLGLQGPAVTLDTACSSSLLAVHLACQSLDRGECDLVLAGGSNLILNGDLTRAFTSSQMLAPDGRCKTFDESADGFSRGEGCGVVVLRRLADAQRDGDRILAVIRGTAANQDGPSSGLTAPNGPAQEAVIRAALSRGGLAPDDLDYMEAHGTGTPLGDPIEMGALGAVFRGRGSPLRVGSVKSAVGHLEASAGVAGLIKAIQVVRRGEVPPQLHFADPSSHIPWDTLPVAIPTRRVALEAPGRPRRAGVSSFGFSGTNVHVIVEQPPDAPASAAAAEEGWRPNVLPLSARTDGALEATVDRWSAYLETAGAPWADICHTAAVGRAAFPHRLAVVASDVAEARLRLAEWRTTGEASGVRTGRVGSADRTSVGFLYTGQGSQYPGMGWELWQASPVYREVIERCAEALDGVLDVDLMDVLDPSGPAADRIHDTALTQPALYALQCGLTELWRAWGVQPAVVLGHSIGEYAAAYRAGVFSLEEGARLVAARGRAMAEVGEAGRMVGVRTDEERALEWVARVGADVSIAALNAPGQVVLSGSLAAVAEVEELAAAAGCKVTPLKTSTAFHSRLMEDAARTFAEVARGAELRPGGEVRFVSTATGAPVSPGTLADPEYWISQILRPVRFTDAVRAAAGLVGHTLELGPHPTLSTLVEQSDTGLSVHHTLVRDRADRAEVGSALQSLWVAGVPLDWSAVGPGRAPVAAPTSVFRPRTLHVDLGTPGSARVRRAGGHPVLGEEIGHPGPDRVFRSFLHADRPGFVADHVVLGRALLPGTCYLEAALSAGRRVTGGDVVVQDVDFTEAMALDTEGRRVQTTLSPDGGGWTFAIHSAAETDPPGSPWVLHAQGRLSGPGAGTDRLEAGASDLAGAIVDAETFYGELEERGYAFGPRLRSVVEVTAGDGRASATVRVPEAAGGPGGYAAHPLLLDGALQVVSTALGADAERAYLPVAMERFEAWGEPGRAGRVRARVRRSDGGVVVADVAVRGDEGGADLRGVLFKEVHPDDLRASPGEPLHEVTWVPAAGTPDAPVPFEEVERGLRTELAETTGRHRLDAYDGFTAALEARSGAYALRALGDLGWSSDVGDELTLGGIAEALEVSQGRIRLLRRVLAMAEEEGLLESAGAPDTWRVLRALERPRVEPPSPEDGGAPEMVLLERCGPHLAAGLRETHDPLELLFPGGDASDAERMYHEAPLARMLNDAIAEVVAGLAEGRPEERPLRILEVGGGTGGTTRRVLDRLDEDGSLHVAYTFTDVGPLFVQRARVRWNGRAGTSFRTFDLDRPPREQGFEEAGWDVVIAANCLHAARDLSSAVEGVSRLLAPGGILLAPEVFEPHRWFDLTVGLTDGWWHFEDVDLRPGYPCVAPGTWEDVLSRAGFAGVRAVRLADEADVPPGGLASRGQGIVVAQRASSTDAGSEAPWLVVTADRDFGRALEGALEARGVRSELVEPEPGGRAVAERLSGRESWAGALFVPGPDGSATGPAGPDPGSATEALAAPLAPLLEVARAAVAGEVTLERGLRIVTRGACLTRADDADLDPVGAAAWGVGRTLPLEASDIRSARLDLDPVPSGTDAEEVAAWLCDDAPAAELALRNGARLTPRLVRRDRDAGPTLPAEYGLGHDGSGSIDGLAFAEAERRAPGAGEVEIRVAATGVNFRDVLNVLGLYPGDPGPLGAECSGVVTRVGPGVDLEPGQRVLASVGGSYGRHVVADSHLVGPLPRHLTFAEGATIPVPYLTAWFALNHLGEMGPGDTVLIHAAAGGVGSAARSLARRAGATVLATAGTEEKRARLREAGVEHVFDSRSDAFVEGVLEATDGAGADLILNSLADELVDASFRVIARGGRFLEIGKRGIWTPEQVAELDRDVRYHVIDWGETSRQDPDTVGRLFREIVGLVRAGEIAPLPLTRFPLEDAADAFRLMARGGHTGKIVLTHPVHDGPGAVTVRDDGTYLVTGGTRGLGLRTAEWLAERGARSLVLLGRSEPAADAAARIEALRSSGVRVEVRLGDVGDGATVCDLVAWIRGELPPLRGVVHAAGTLSDATLANATWNDFEAVFRSKVEGTVNLADAGRGEPLDFFVGYSSIASLFGSPGQANHAAANRFLDVYTASLWGGIDHPMSIEWGPWGDTGSAARDDVLERTRAIGIGALDDEEGLRQLAAAFQRPAPVLVGMRLERPEALAERGGRELLADLLDERASAAGAGSAVPPGAGGAAGLREALETVPVAARPSKLREAIRARVHSVLGLAPGTQVDPDQPLGELGLDSLLAVELRNALGTTVGERLPATLLFDHPTLEALAGYLGRRLGLEDGERPGGGEEAASAPLTSADLVESLEDLTDEEVDRLLGQNG